METTDSGSKPVKVELIRPAQVPSSPVSPRTQLNLILGALLGLMVGVGHAWVDLVAGSGTPGSGAEYLGVEGSIGLTDGLSGQARVDEAIMSWQRGLLDFLPCGAISPNPSELLGSRQLADLLTEFDTRYDVVILDAPPPLPVTDAAILAAAADGAILVTRYGATSREQAEQAADSLRQVNARLFGTVLNFVPKKRRSRDYDYDYSKPTKGKDNHDGQRMVTDEDTTQPAPGI